MEPFHGKAKLVSPAVTNGAPPSMGTGWLDSFLKACTGCHIDAIAIHIYDSATNTAYFQNYISSVASKYGKPVWVTEVRRVLRCYCRSDVCTGRLTAYAVWRDSLARAVPSRSNKLS